MSNEQVTSGRKGRAVYSSVKLHAKRDRKRRDAETRQHDYDKLSLKDKIALAKSRRGESKRELARLNKQVKAIKASKPVTNTK